MNLNACAEIYESRYVELQTPDYDPFSDLVAWGAEFISIRKFELYGPQSIRFCMLLALTEASPNESMFPAD